MILIYPHIEALCSGCFLSARALYLCTACADYAEKNLLCNSDKDTDSKIEEIINLIKNNKISNIKLQELLKAIIGSQILDLYIDCATMQKQYKNFLQTVDVVKWVKNRNFIILTILLSLLGCELENLSGNYFILLAFSI